MFNIESLQSKSTTELTKICKDLGIKVARNSTENDKVFAILDFQAANPKVAKEYYNATEEKPENTTENQTPEKKTTKRKRVEKPAEENISDKKEETESKTEKPAKEEKKTTPKAKKSPKNTKEKEANTPAAAVEENISEEKTNEGEKPLKKKNKQKENSKQSEKKEPENEEQNPPKKEFNFDNIVIVEGVLEILPDNYGFLRSSDFNYISSPDDVFVSTNQIRNYGLKTGDTVKGIVRLPKEGEKYFSLQKALEVNGRDLHFIKDRVAFEYLTPLFPQEKFNLTGKNSTLSTRIVDLFAPIGKGQRAMIVAQPKTGKTMLLKDIANSISANHPEAYMMILLIDERPEEVTDMQRSVNAEVIASTFDEAAEKHVKVANLVLSKAQRMVECGHDVVILLDYHSSSKSL